MRRLSIAVAGLALALPLAAQETGNPLSKDRTGMPWVLPFEEAWKTAHARKRLLLVKPVAFGTSPDGGW